VLEQLFLFVKDRGGGVCPPLLIIAAGDVPAQKMWDSLMEQHF
jgi:hypothetical protein